MIIERTDPEWGLFHFAHWMPVLSRDLLHDIVGGGHLPLHTIRQWKGANQGDTAGFFEKIKGETPAESSTLAQLAGMGGAVEDHIAEDFRKLFGDIVYPTEGGGLLWAEKSHARKAFADSYWSLVLKGVTFFPPSEPATSRNRQRLVDSYWSLVLKGVKIFCAHDLR